MEGGNGEASSREADVWAGMATVYGEARKGKADCRTGMEGEGRAEEGPGREPGREAGYASHHPSQQTHPWESSLTCLVCLLTLVLLYINLTSSAFI